MIDDRLEIAWRKLGEQVREKEAQLKREQAALDELRAQFELLDRARVVVLQATSAGEAAGFKQSAQQIENTKHSLMRDALSCVKAAKRPDGVTAAAVAEMLQDFLGYQPPSTKQAFYSGVYTTLKRLAEKGEVIAKRGEKGLVFAPLDQTERLFQ